MKFELGTRVEVTEGYYTGRYGTVTRACEAVPLVELDHGGGEWFFYDTQLKIITQFPGGTRLKVPAHKVALQ